MKIRCDDWVFGGGLYAVIDSQYIGETRLDKREPLYCTRINKGPSEARVKKLQRISESLGFPYK